MSMEPYAQNGAENHPPKELFAVYLTDGLLYDRLNRLAAEYSLPVELLASLAVKRLVVNVDLVRELRRGHVEGA